MREIRTLRVMWRELETGPGGISELPRQFPTLPLRQSDRCLHFERHLIMAAKAGWGPDICEGLPRFSVRRNRECVEARGQPVHLECDPARQHYWNRYVPARDQASVRESGRRRTRLLG